MDQESTVVVDEDPQKRAFTTGHARVRDERTDEHVAHPSLIGTFGFVATKGSRLAG
jgi:hypothetical protein